MVTELEKLSEQFLWKTGNMSINIAFINYSCSHYLGASLIQRAFALNHKNEKTCFSAWSGFCSEGRSLVRGLYSCMVPPLAVPALSFESPLPFSIVWLTLRHSCVPLALWAVFCDQTVHCDTLHILAFGSVTSLTGKETITPSKWAIFLHNSGDLLHKQSVGSRLL